jgi:oligoribonuclease NrnB/cAMP/cGMP phosphodiesterase (DHH superfamily)
MYERIVTHDDFDGIVSAAICSHVFGIQEFKFAGPRTIAESKITITDEDVVCDLPYPLACGLWFDHHQGNMEELKYRGIDPDGIDGCFALEPSCSRVVYDYFSRTDKLPPHFQETVKEADVIDSFAYQSIDEWRRETPGKVIDSTLKLRSAERKERIQYMQWLVLRLRDQGLSEVAGLPEVQEQYRRFRAEEEQMIEQIRQDATFLLEDNNRELIIIDLTKHNRQPTIVKNLAYLVYPESLGVIEIKNRFHKQVKTNDLSFSMSLSLNLNEVEHGKDVGEIMRVLNIGDGHSGAGAGTVDCKSKDEMLRKKQEIISRIYKIWSDR